MSEPFDDVCDEVREGVPPPPNDPSWYTMDKWSDMRLDVCPHCQHDWSHHIAWSLRCTVCGCQWPTPTPPKPPPTPPTAQELLNARVRDAIWEGFEAEDNACVDREDEFIDTGDFSMARVAQHVINKLGLMP